VRVGGHLALLFADDDHSYTVQRTRVYCGKKSKTHAAAAARDFDRLPSLLLEGELTHTTRIAAGRTQAKLREVGQELSQSGATSGLARCHRRHRGRVGRIRRTPSMPAFQGFSNSANLRWWAERSSSRAGGAWGRPRSPASRRVLSPRNSSHPLMSFSAGLQRRRRVQRRETHIGWQVHK
jgi:hypothetical protein